MNSKPTMKPQLGTRPKGRRGTLSVAKTTTNDDPTKPHFNSAHFSAAELNFSVKKGTALAVERK